MTLVMLMLVLREYISTAYAHHLDSLLLYQTLFVNPLQVNHNGRFEPFGIWYLGVSGDSI